MTKIYECLLYAGVFVPIKPFQPVLILARLEPTWEKQLLRCSA